MMLHSLQWLLSSTVYLLIVKSSKQSKTVQELITNIHKEYYTPQRLLLFSQAFLLVISRHYVQCKPQWLKSLKPDAYGSAKNGLNDSGCPFSSGYMSYLYLMFRA
jgi:hypothetical protein